MEHYYALILAGGGGTRLWPMSRKEIPKQFLPLVEDDSMFKVTVDRLAPLFTPDRIYVVTGQNYVETMQKDAPDIPKENFIVEPYGRDTAPATGLGMAVIHKRDPEAVVAMLTADHHIGKKEVFRDVLEKAGQIAQNDHIVTLGISPSHPATGFGYIKQGEEVKKIGDYTCYHVEEFTEKPNEVTATAFIASGKYSWNSGMFIWKTTKAMAEFERQQPAMHTLLFGELQSTIDTSQYNEKLNAIWEKLEKISVDFAIMEGAQQMAVIPIDIGWSDVGSWASLYEVLSLDSDGNGFKGNAPERITIDTENTLVFSDRLTVTIGLEDIIIIDTKDALLICRKDKSQSVREVVNHLKSHNLDEYL